MPPDLGCCSGGDGCGLVVVLVALLAGFVVHLLNGLLL